MAKRRKRPAPPHGADAKDKPYRPQFALAVVCANEREQRRLYNRLRKQGLEPRVLTI